MALPGMMMPPGLVGSGTEPLSTISLHDNAQSTSNTITVPAGVVAGDLILLCDSAVGEGTPTKVVPSGFTELASINQSSYAYTVSYKVADGTEGGVAITGQSSNSNKKLLAVLRGNVGIASATGGGVKTSGVTADDPAAISITASGGTAPLIVIGTYWASATISPRTFSPSADGELGHSSGTLWIAWRLDEESGQDTTVDQDDENTGNALIGGYLALTI